MNERGRVQPKEVEMSDNQIVLQIRRMIWARASLSELRFDEQVEEYIESDFMRGFEDGCIVADAITANDLLRILNGMDAPVII